MTAHVYARRRTSDDPPRMHLSGIFVGLVLEALVVFVAVSAWKLLR